MTWFGKGRTDVPRAWAAALEQVLKGVDPGRQVARRQIVEFVLTGRHADALTTLGTRHPPVLQIGRRNNPVAKKDLTTLYAGFGDVDAAVLRRWGRVLDATRGVSKWGLTLGELDGCCWPELMLEQGAAGVPASDPMPFTFADLVRIAAVDGSRPADLVRMAFAPGPFRRYASKSSQGYLSRLPGFADAVVTHSGIPAKLLVSGAVDERVGAASLLGALGGDVLGPLAGPLAEAATSSSSKVRDAARPLITRIDLAAADPLRRLAEDGKPERRAYALELLAALPDQRDWAVQTAASDRAASVRALSARWETADAPSVTPAALVPDLPPLPSWALSAADAERVANQVLDAVRRGVAARNRSTAAQRQRHPNHPFFQEISEPPRGGAARLMRVLAADRPAHFGDKLAGIPAPTLIAEQVAGAIGQYRYPATTAVQVMTALGWLDRPQRGDRPWAEVIDEVHARTGALDLLTVQRMFDAAGADGRELVWSAYSSSWGFRVGRDWADDQVWPFVVHNLDWLLDEASSRQGWDTDEHAVFAAIATLPSPPARLVDRLYALAVGPRKSDRAPAQAALERDPQRTARAAAALVDGKSDVRLSAAQWLAKIADPSALPPLIAAWKKEKHDVVRGALLDALIAVGEDAASYLDPAVTATTAEKFVAKGMPSSLAWLDWGGTPAAHLGVVGRGGAADSGAVALRHCGESQVTRAQRRAAALRIALRHHCARALGSSAARRVAARGFASDLARRGRVASGT